MADAPQANPVGNVIPDMGTPQVQTPGQATPPTASGTGTSQVYTNTGGDKFFVNTPAIDPFGSIPDRQ
jgi:hypothetical protein